MSEPKRVDPPLDQQLAKVLDSLGAAFKANPPMPEPPPTAKIIQLPLWPEAAPGMPNALIRSALFPAIKSKDRQWLKREKIASIDGVEIIFSGQQFNQQDFDVAVNVFNIARNDPLGTVCHTSAHGLLKKLQWATGNEQHVQLYESLLRLCNTFEVIGERYKFFGSIIVGGIRDEVTKQYVIRVNPDVSGLFRQGWTQIDQETRRKLRGKDLAQWLQTQYASHHPRILPYSVELLRTLSGSRTKELRSFRQNLRQALTELQAAGVIARWEIDEADNVHVHKVPTITQRRPK